MIVATGTTPRMDGYPIATPGEPIRGFERSNVVSIHDLLSAPARSWGASAVVVDEIGHYEAIAAAEYLIAKGLAVTFVTRHISFAPLLETTFTNVPSLQRLEQGNFQLRTRSRLVSVDDQGALIAPTYQPAGGNALERVAADTVVMVGINQPNRALHDELAASGIEARLVGEAATANFLGRAVHSGRLAGLKA
ncbi:MAG: hypothetical protein F4118_07050 [Acidimicrobiaceae bacterium]|nr:hypothetical protein [Acidimicrobiaceae bacterium]